MRPMRTFGLALVVVAAATASYPALAAQPWTPLDIAPVGAQMLLDEKWDEAADLLGPYSRPLDSAVAAAWDSTAQLDDARRDRVRYGLVYFYVGYGDLSLDRGGIAVRRLAEWGPEYVAIVKRLPEVEKTLPTVGFSHLELLRSLARLNAHLMSDADFAAALAAVRQDPESAPAIALCLWCLGRRDGNHRERRELERLAVVQAFSSDLGRLTLARSASAGETWWRGHRIRLLDEGWRLAPNYAQRANLLLALAEAYESQRLSGTRSPEEAAIDLRSALATAAEVYTSFPTTPAAAGARECAVRLTTRGAGPDAGLALARQLQQGVSTPPAGLDRALLNLCGAFATAGQAAEAAALLEEIVRDYPQSEVLPQALLGLAGGAKVRGDTEMQRELLQRCIAFEAVPGTRQYRESPAHWDAIEALALLNEAEGNWAGALGLWKDWGDCSTCGTGAAAHDNIKMYRIAHCQAHLGEQAAAAALLVAGMRGSFGDERTLADTAFRLYRAADQLGDLKAIVAEIEERKLAEYSRTSFRNRTDEELRSLLPTARLRSLLNEEEVDAADGRHFGTWTAPPPIAGSLPGTLDEVRELTPKEFSAGLPSAQPLARDQSISPPAGPWFLFGGALAISVAALIVWRRRRKQAARAVFS